MTIPTSLETNYHESELEFLHQVQKYHEALLDSVDYNEINRLQENKEKLREYLQKEAQQLIQKKENKESPNIANQKRLIEAIIDEIMGFGPVEALLRNEEITDIFINSPDTVFIERRGRVEKIPIYFLDNDHIFRLVQRVASKSGRHLDLGTPYFDAQLPDGSRIHAIIPPIAIDGIKVSIRKYSFSKLDIQRLVDSGSLTSDMAALLKIAVQARLNIAICGGTGSGKTTLLNSMLASVRKGERMITIEDTPELEASHHHVVRLLTRIANPEGKGAVTQADLMINALRMRPDRVILGELRGAEAFNLLHAMNTGQDGSMVTLHASGTDEVISRLLNMILMARYTLSVESVKQQIAGALDLIVHVCRLVNGSRRVMTISQVSEKNGEVNIEDIFKYRIDKISPDELQGKFERYDVKPTNRIENKLIVAGLSKEYNSIFNDEKNIQELQESLVSLIDNRKNIQ